MVAMILTTWIRAIARKRASEDVRTADLAWWREVPIEVLIITDHAIIEALEPK
jgi:hypothetical protein